jgi:azurin
LYIDGQRVVNNDGNHASVERSGEITLSGGGHKLEVTYFDSGGGDSLVVSWQGPGIHKQPIPAKALGMAGPSYATQVAAVRAIQSLPLDGAAKFADFAKVIANGKGRSAAIPAALAIHEKDWPVAAVKSLGAEYASVAAETPFAQRDGAAFKQTLALGEKLIAKLPAAEAKKLRESLGNLDLQVVRIATIYEKMKYNKAAFSVVSGKPTKIIFVNDDVMPHNLLLAAPGSLNDLGAAADKMAADPKGFDKHFIPEDKRVLWATKLLQPGQTAELSFIAPKPGAYPYICTFPLHWKLMNGVMHVVPEEAAKK